MALDLSNIDWIALGQRLQNARKAIGKNQGEAAKVLDIGRTTMVAVEQGRRPLSPSELVKLASFYSVDLNILVGRHIPVSDLGVAFRYSFDKRLLETVGESDAEKAVALLQKYAENYLQLETLLGVKLARRYPAEYSYKDIPVDVAADEIATQERSRLNLGDSPILRLRSLLEAEVGLRIFYLPLASQIAGMFGYTEELGGCIAINIKHPPERQRMTLAHEYAHFLTQRSSPDIQILRTYERYPESERFANAFSYRFLLPESLVRRQLRSHIQSAGTDAFTLGNLLQLARYNGVSFEAFGYRLEELGILVNGTVERLKIDGLKVRKAQELVGIEPESPVESQMLPERYRFLAVSAFLQEEITEGQLAQFLNVERLEARDIVHELSSLVTFDEESQFGSTPIQVEETLSVRSR